MENLEQTKRERLETSEQVITGLLHYHDRMTNPMKAINKKPSVNLGIDVYREALVCALELIEEKLKGE